MADAETNSREAAAELRIARGRALGNHDLVAVGPTCWPGTRTRSRRCLTTRSAPSVRRRGTSRTGAWLFRLAMQHEDPAVELIRTRAACRAAHLARRRFVVAPSGRIGGAAPAPPPRRGPARRPAACSSGQALAALNEGQAGAAEQRTQLVVGWEAVAGLRLVQRLAGGDVDQQRDPAARRGTTATQLAQRGQLGRSGSAACSRTPSDQPASARRSASGSAVASAWITGPPNRLAAARQVAGSCSSSSGRTRFLAAA